MADPKQKLSDLIRVNDESVVHSSAWFTALVSALNDLIAQDFNKLVQVLYEADVPEDRLKKLLAASGGADAATVIANMLLERLLQRIASRKFLKTKPPAESADELW